MSESMSSFVESQDALNNISSSLKYMYGEDPIFGTPEKLKELTERTFEVMDDVDKYTKDLLNDNHVKNTADGLDMPIKEVVDDVVFVMLYSTIARQSLIMDNMLKRIEELEETDG